MKLSALAAALALILGFSPMAWGQPAEKARHVGILFTLPDFALLYFLTALTHLWASFSS